jgi:hypothetical protein
MEWIQLAQGGSSGGLCEYNNEHSGFIRIESFLFSQVKSSLSREKEWLSVV